MPAIEHEVSRHLLNQKRTLSLAESCTGGLIASRLTDIPGSSNFLKLAVIAYSNLSKIKVLKVPETIITEYGAVSSQTAVSMARNVRRITGSDLGLGVTGIAGPTGGSKAKPVGLVYMAACTKAETLCLECRFRGTRKSIKAQAATEGLRLLYEFLI